MTELALPVPAADVPAAPSRFGERFVHAVYYLFVLSIPWEAVLYIRDNKDDPGSTVSAARLIGILLFGVALLQPRLCFKRVPKGFWLVAWYLSAYALSQLWIPAALDARFQEQQITLLQMAVLFLISANLFSDEEFRARLLRLYGWALVPIALAIVVGLLGDPFAQENRSSIGAANPNTAAALFAFAAVCLAGDSRLLRAGRRWRHVLASIAGVAVLTAGIMKTGSRGGLFSFAAGIAAVAVCGGRTTRAARTALAVLILGLAGAMTFREFRNDTAMAERLRRSWDDGDTAGRTTIYDAAWSMFEERPLLGWGGANNRFLLGTYLDKVDFRGQDADRDTHNLFLNVLTEVGVAGGGPFIAALLLALWLAWRRGRLTGDPLPFALMWVLLIVNTSMTGDREKIFWIVLAAAFASPS